MRDTGGDEDFDLFSVDRASGQSRDLSNFPKNTGEFASYIADPDFKVRMATKSRPDGGSDLLEPDGKGGWKLAGEIPFADSLTSFPGGYTRDGKTQYFFDSRGRNTTAL